MVCTAVSTVRVLLRINHSTLVQRSGRLSGWHVSRTILCCPCTFHRKISFSPQNYQKAEKEQVGSVIESKQSQSNNQLSTNFKEKAEKAKDNAKTASYGMVIVVGVAITGYIAYTILSELFSSNSPNAMYEKAAKLCISHPKVQDMLGEPIKVYGEESRRGRRNRVTHLFYQDETGRKGLRIQFYLQGCRNRGVAQLDAREDSSGHFQTRFLLVNVEDFLRNTIVVMDNR